MSSETLPRANFGALRGILLGLGFSEQSFPDRVRFEHPATQTWFLYPPYRDDEDVPAGDLVAARHILDMKGFLTREQFERLLREKVMAG